MSYIIMINEICHVVYYNYSIKADSFLINAVTA